MICPLEIVGTDVLDCPFFSALSLRAALHTHSGLFAMRRSDTPHDARFRLAAEWIPTHAVLTNKYGYQHYYRVLGSRAEGGEVQIPPAKGGNQKEKPP